MALDPYDPCPCRSGKKFKFCCQPLGSEISSIERLMEDENFKQALIVIDKVSQQHPLNRIVLQNKILALDNLRRADELRQTVEQYVKFFPGEDRSLLFEMDMSIRFEKWETARGVVEARFMALARLSRQLAFVVASDLMELHIQNRRLLAGMAWYRTALMLAPNEESHSEIVSMMASLRRSYMAPVSIVPNLELKTLPEGQPFQEEFSAALALAADFKWLEAARKFESLTNKDPHQPAHYINAGFCYGFAGDLAASTEMLGQAADELPDFEYAVELEALAQWQELELDDECVHLPIFNYGVTGPISKLLTELDSLPYLRREREAQLPPSIQALYFVIDRHIDSKDPIDPKNAPRLLAELGVYPADVTATGMQELHVMSVVEEFQLAQCEAILEPIKELLDNNPEHSWGQARHNTTIPIDTYRLHSNRDFRDLQDRKKIAEAAATFQEHLIYELWAQTPLRSLDDLTPEQAARDPELHLPVCAAILTLAKFAYDRKATIDIPRLRKQLGLPELAPFLPEDKRQIYDAGFFSRRRIPFEALHDDESRQALFQVLRISDQDERFLEYAEFLYEHREEFQPVPLFDLCVLANQIAGRRFHLPSIRAWVKRGRQCSLELGHNLKERLKWDLNEFYSELQLGDEDSICDLLARLEKEVFPKVPEFREECLLRLTEAGLATPRVRAILQHSDLVAVGDGTVSSGGIWTPGASEAPAGGKLWVPGE